MEYSEKLLIEKLRNLKTAPESIQTTAFWFKLHRKHAKDSVATWAQEILRVKAKEKIIFMYVCNEVLQTSKKQEEFGVEFQKVLPNVFENAFNADLKPKIARILDVWLERKVYSPEFIKSLEERADLRKHTESLPSEINPVGNSNIFPQSIRAIELLPSLESVKLDAATKINGIRSSLYLEDSFKQLNDNASLDKLHSELDSAIEKVKLFINTIDSEMKARKALITELSEIVADHTLKLTMVETSRKQMIEKLDALEKVKTSANARFSPEQNSVSKSRDGVHPATMERLTLDWSNDSNGF